MTSPTLEKSELDREKNLLPLCEMAENFGRIRKSMSPNQSIEVEYRKADISCIPSLYEGYPNVVAEAMSCGLPILCSNVCENPYIVEEGVNGFLFNPESPENIATAINKMICLTKTERQEMGIRNRILCLELERNTEDAFLKSYVKLIDNLK